MTTSLPPFVTTAGELQAEAIDHVVQFDYDATQRTVGDDVPILIYRVNGTLRRIHHDPNHTVVALAAAEGDLTEFMLEHGDRILIDPERAESIRPER